jgi:hypothetical protein
MLKFSLIKDLSVFRVCVNRSVRGFISIAAKKHSIKIESAKNEAGDRVYKIAK